ncbi:MAG: hypothetical protein JXA96_06655 [Sedimentisphaerales bacterium]|nr:hypothetical protein [Sedimentisphaerales bacterium]
MGNKKSTKQSKTIEDLQKASEALYYEIMMLNNCASSLSECSKNRILFSQFTVNILIESFCVHLRNLIEFFGKKKTDSDRITNEHFLPESVNVSYPYNLKKKYSGKVNNLLSHLTFHRLSYPINQKEWNLNQIANEVNEDIIQFYNKADKHLLCPKIIEYINAFQSGDKMQYNSYTCSTSDATLPSGTITKFSKES